MPASFHTRFDSLSLSCVSLSPSLSYLLFVQRQFINQIVRKEFHREQTRRHCQRNRAGEKGTVPDVHCNLVVHLIKCNHIYKETLSSLRFYFYYFELHKYQLIMSLFVKNGGFGTRTERQEGRGKEKITIFLGHSTAEVKFYS